MIKFIQTLSRFSPYLSAKLTLKLFLTPKKYKRPESEKEWYESAHKKILNCGYAVNEWGDFKKPIVLLIHGWEGRGAQLGAFVTPLVSAGFFVVALDGPAHGDSPGIQTNAGEFARAIAAVQNELGKVHAIIAHSFGGGCSILATQFGLKVDQIVSIASPSNYLDVVNFFLDHLMLNIKSKQIVYSLLEKKAQLKISEIQIAEIIEQLTQGKNIQGLIIHDENDKEVSVENAYILHQHWKNSKLLITKGLGHRRILKDGDVANQVVAFLQN